ncbi:MAG: hypothetical protein M1819_001164 [Sarea resinae]|nr:MAG: hypothetical protein M1819_001164 [Sarea resinae]
MTTAAPLQATPIHEISNISLKNSASTLDATKKNVDYPIPRGPVTTQLLFYAPPADGSSPYNYVEELPKGEPQRNFGDNEQPVRLDDIRGRENDYNLDHNAFEAISHVPSDEKDFEDDNRVKQVYYPEVEKLLLEHVPGANRVFIFDHTIRRSGPNAHRTPVTRTHIDQTPASAEARVHHHLPEEAESLLRGRYRLINIWRPLNGPVASFPLGFADSSTVNDEDLVGVRHIYPDRDGETAGVKYNPNQQWHYWSGMTNDERLLLKCYDSDEALGSWGRVPHTAFVDPRTSDKAPGRESIEVRALVFG